MSKVQNGNGKHTNGHSNGNGAVKETVEDAWKKKIARADTIEKLGWHYVLLAFAAVTLLPIAILWCWLCIEFNQGAMILPKEYTLNGISSWWFDDVYYPLLKHAMPTFYTTKIYFTWVLFQAVLFLFAPGPVGEGLPILYGFDKGKKLKYTYNGQFAWFTTLVAAAVLHTTGIFKLTELYDHFASLQTICNLYTYGIIALLYVWGWAANRLERRTDSLIYDYFMGPMLNPRVKIFGSYEFDFKWFHELRPGIMHWFFTTVAMAIRQYETYGTVSTPMMLIVYYHLCFVNACYKGEHCVPFTIDIIYEKFGWMLCWLDLVTVPFVFPLQALYLYKMGPYEHPVWYTVLMFLMHTIGYWMFDTANSQKDYFRNKDGDLHTGFPKLPWGKLNNPKFLETKRGTKLLLDGWWKYARHMNYTGDLMMAWCWGMTCGFNSYFPYAYTTYLTPLLLHRERRDNLECQQKYGKDWDEYCKRVPYRFIPYIY